MNDAIAHQLIAALEKHNKLLEQQLQQREKILTHWKQTNPELAKKCSAAARVLAEVQTRLFEEIIETTESPDDNLNTFTMHEFIDKYGSRLVQLSAMVQLFAQLGGD